MIEICYFIAGNWNGQSLGYIFVCHKFRTAWDNCVFWFWTDSVL